MTAEEKELFLTISNALCFSLRANMQLLDKASDMQEEKYMIMDILEKLRTARNAVFNEEEVAGNIKIEEGRFLKYYKNTPSDQR